MLFVESCADFIDDILIAKNLHNSIFPEFYNYI